uniref:Chemokine interleukin-8-like domain-containing protein n=1 Tax=Poecilia latipinna TaxID=48699 RepID=A0A3B3UZM8_9TELE
KKYLALALLLCVLISLSDSQCIFKRRTPGKTKHSQNTYGIYMHTFHCFFCLPSDFRYATPRRFPEDCVSVFDPKACQYVVHKKDNPSVLCPIFAVRHEYERHI